MKQNINIIWFRRDLRTTDNAALYHALKSECPVLPVFIFDTVILDMLENKADRRVEFIHRRLLEMQDTFTASGSSFYVLQDEPASAFKQLLKEYTVHEVFANEDYEPYATTRDETVSLLLKKHGATLKLHKDQVILSKKEVLKDNGDPYTVFTPYSRKWKAVCTDFHFTAYPSKKYYSNLFQTPAKKIPTLKALGFKESGEAFPPKNLNNELVDNYGDRRDYPGIRGTSHLGMHLRFGSISIRGLVSYAAAHSPVFLNELIWREFYQMILWHFPHVGKGKAFKPAYDHINWRHAEKEFAQWCKGETGYPIVDAGMRELNETGFMHNRVRMITASFLCKHLLIDWRWGEAYFAEKLLDYDLASNNGGWQWAAGSGCDSAPYFRIFNPYLQTKKFDHDLKYIRKWVPEFEEPQYPEPMVNHVFARERCLATYKKGLDAGRP